MSDNSVHARFSPSKLPRILLCPGSAGEEEIAKPQAPSSYADEGTYLHAITADLLELEQYHVSTILHEDKDKHLEYKAAVEECLDWVFTTKCNNVDEASKEFVETKVSLKGFVEPFGCGLLADVEGTADWRYEANRTLWVTDWKFGKGIKVDSDSSQLKAYAAGALRTPARAALFDRIICTVGQPRINDEHFPSVTYTPNDILRWVQFELSPGLMATQAHTPVFKPSHTACRWCPAKNTCKARHNMALTTAQEVFAAHAALPNKITFEEIKAILDMAPQLETYISNLTEYVFNIITSGQDFPGYKVVRGRSIRQWVDEKHAQQTLEEQGFDISALSEIKFFSPTKVEKVLGKKSKEPFFTDLVIKPEGKLTLAHEADKREPVKFQSAEELFADYASSENALDGPVTQ